ncbi:membrane protein [Betaproteobacteria bacterium]|nr:membrane protein [Betaproteobacteria bacterium]GHU43170.1 membrane protein [Betaproteobacteria bacterium]
MSIEFDPLKAQANLKKHGIRFEEAATCLLDPLALVQEDGDVEGEQRWVLVGMSNTGRLLTVVYTLRGDMPRLISARKATKKEEKSYA